MKIGKIESVFEIKNFETFQEWFNDYKENIIDPYSENIYPDTPESRSMINSMIKEINRTIHDKWIEYGCGIPEIKNVIITNTVTGAN
ncbi:hypothetical protein KAR91_02315 [Candidatus Pacearchaeota archaeon]|nr:hypothetical protein [Candidatus Pacearchaeota archaeon]